MYGIDVAEALRFLFGTKMAIYAWHGNPAILAGKPTT